jgi:CreA protein
MRNATASSAARNAASSSAARLPDPAAVMLGEGPAPTDLPKQDVPGTDSLPPPNATFPTMQTATLAEQRPARCKRLLTATLLTLLTAPAFAQTQIDSINTAFRWLGPDDKIIVERYDDPRVGNVSCYLSRAETGGIKGGLGFAEDPSRFSIACRAVGPVTLPDSMPKREIIAFSQASLFFKTFQIHRALDAEKHVLVYTVVSTKLINGSPFNSISVVPTDVR